MLRMSFTVTGLETLCELAPSDAMEYISGFLKTSLTSYVITASLSASVAEVENDVGSSKSSLF